MTTYGKIRSIAAVMIIFLVVLATNLIDKDNFAQVEESVEKIYEEQLKTKDAIIDLTNLIHEKRIAILTQDTNYYTLRKGLSNEQISSRIDDCEKGEVNREEGYILDDLRENCNHIFQLEKADSTRQLLNNSAYWDRISLIEEEIQKLAEVQMEEGKRQKLISRDALASAKLFSRIEIYLLVAIAIVVQLIILYPKKKTILHDED